MEWTKVENSGFWTPEKKGDEIIGVLVDKKVGQFGQAYDLLTEDGVLTLPTLTILNSRLSSIELKTKVKIVFLGHVTTAKGQAKDFEVFTSD